MTNGERENSGELSSFLHLTGWRPLVLALVAGLAGAFGLFNALSAPAEFQARYTFNAQRIADDDFQPAELNLFARELAVTANFPQTAQAVEERTGLVIEDDYNITVNQSGQTQANVDVNVVAGRPEDAQLIAVETSIETMTVTLTKDLNGHEASAAQIEESLADTEAIIAELTEQADFINPATAYDLAIADLAARRDFLRNPPTETITLADGNTVTREVPEPAPPLEELRANASRLEPIDRAYRNEIAALDALNLRLADRSNDIRDARAALALVATEREDPIIISEVVTEETSRIAGLLTGLLLFAIPAALLVILLFVIYDALRKKPEQQLDPAHQFEAAGALAAESQPALPEGARAPLVVVDEEIPDDEPDEEILATPASEHDILADEDELVVDGDEPDDDEPDDKKRSKDGRWGRDASSKAG